MGISNQMVIISICFYQSKLLIEVYLVIVMSCHVFLIPRTAARQASLSFTISHSLLKLMSIELVMPSNHLVLCHPLLFLPSIFPVSGSFLMSWLFASGGQSIGASASTSVLPMTIQDWFPLRLTGLITLQSKRLSRVFFITTVQSINSSVFSLLYGLHRF